MFVPAWLSRTQITSTHGSATAVPRAASEWTETPTALTLPARLASSRAFIAPLRFRFQPAEETACSSTMSSQLVCRARPGTDRPPRRRRRGPSPWSWWRSPRIRGRHSAEPGLPIGANRTRRRGPRIPPRERPPRSGAPESQASPFRVWSDLPAHPFVPVPTARSGTERPVFSQGDRHLNRHGSFLSCKPAAGEVEGAARPPARSTRPRLYSVHAQVRRDRDPARKPGLRSPIA